MLSTYRLISLASIVAFVGVLPKGVFAPLPVVFPVETWPICYISGRAQGTCEKLVDCPQAVETVYRGLHPPACYWERHQTFPQVCCPENGFNEVLEPERRVPIIPYLGNDKQTVCGHASVDSSSSNHVWPWMVSIYHDEEDTPVGSGFLIDDRHVLSAAQNIPSRRQQDKWSVRLQRERPNVNGEVTSNPAYNVEDIKVHEGFRSWVRYDDLALITLGEPIQNVEPICLPPSDFNPSSLAGANATILGAHRSEKVPVVSSSWCSEMYSKFQPLSYPRGLNDQFFCAGLQLNDHPSAPSVDDIGGPVITQSKDGLWVAMGLVSLDYKSCEQGLPGVYLNLAHYKDWIDNQLAAPH